MEKVDVPSLSQISSQEVYDQDDPQEDTGRFFLDGPLQGSLLFPAEEAVDKKSLLDVGYDVSVVEILDGKVLLSVFRMSEPTNQVAGRLGLYRMAMS